MDLFEAECRDSVLEFHCQKTKKKSKKQAGKSSSYLNVLRGSLKKWTNEWHRIVIEHLIPPLKDSKVLIPLRQF